MRFGLRARLIVAFGLGALVLSALLAVVTYSLVRENLVRQRESGAVRQAYLNARVMRDAVRGVNQTDQAVLDSLETPTGASPILLREGQWYAANPIDRGREQLPVELRDTVAAGTPGRMRFDLDGHAQLGVGVPIPSIDAAYFEIASFDEVEKSLASLRISLLAAGLVTTVIGAGLGLAVNRQVLRPISHVGAAARAIAGGRLDTRVARVNDADLGPVIDSFNEMATALQERIERDARFASDVSHELRSPLTTLTASLGVLEARRAEMPERAQAALDLLGADVTRFSSMVEDLLEISRFDAGAAHLHLEPVRVGELVQQAVATTGDSVRVRVSADAAFRTVLVDKRRLVRVIANLLTNAERYAGGATLVDADVSEHDGQPVVRIAVEDNGPGVVADDRIRVFERFARSLDAAGRRGSGEGVGLGLALVQEHIALHGGQVWVEDRADGLSGARFVMELPGAAQEVPPEEDMGPAAVPAEVVESGTE
jgi:signal transduction histidine kinase